MINIYPGGVSETKGRVIYIKERVATKRNMVIRELGQVWSEVVGRPTFESLPESSMAMPLTRLPFT
jgi:hypothetical protein